MKTLNYYKQLWNLLDDGEPFSSYSALLQPVLFEGEKCILKIAVREKDKRGNELMGWWNGDGAAPVLRHDDTAILMDRATGSGSLAEMARNGGDDEASRIICSAEMARNGGDDEASRIICSAVIKLHVHKRPYPNELVPLEKWFKDLESAAARYGGVLDSCNKIADELLSDPIEQTVLHGDIHHGNILDFGTKGWLAIDPKGLFGERGFDYANLFCNPDIPTATKPGRLAQQVKVISAEAGLEPKRLLQWTAAWAGLSAAWAHDDDDVGAEPAFTVAKMAISELGFH